METFDLMFPEKLPADANPVIKDFYNYYVGRAYHPCAINSDTSAWDSTTPDKAHSKYFSDNVYEKLNGAKDEIVVPGATHVDLYDQMDKIPFKHLVEFFDKNLTA